MKKDFTRDYATEAFRLYAVMGKPTYEAARNTMYEIELSKRANIDPSMAVIQAETAVDKNTAFLLDIMAVEKTIELLERGGKGFIVKAVKEVYFVQPNIPLRKGDISARVHHFGLECPASERAVYLWLKEARLLCAAIRGLRISEADTRKYRIDMC